jgi:hypothetical protein
MTRTQILPRFRLRHKSFIQKVVPVKNLLTCLIIGLFSATAIAAEKPKTKSAPKAVTVETKTAEEATEPKQNEETEDALSESSRSRNRFGIDLGLIDPYPGVIGGIISFNVFDFVRARGGLNYYSDTLLGSLTTFGFGVQGFVPGWNFSPALGLHWANVNYTAGTLLGDLQGFTSSGNHFYFSGGIDWQAEGGFHIGLGINKSFKSGVDLLPYLNIGWFFL